MARRSCRRRSIRRWAATSPVRRHRYRHRTRPGSSGSGSRPGWRRRESSRLHCGGSLKIGRRKFALPASAIAEAIRAAAHRQGAAVISPAEASAHVADLIAGLSRTPGRLSASQVEAVHATAAELGLRPRARRPDAAADDAGDDPPPAPPGPMGPDRHGRPQPGQSGSARSPASCMSCATRRSPSRREPPPTPRRFPVRVQAPPHPWPRRPGHPSPAWIATEVSAAIEEAIRQPARLEPSLRILVSTSEADRTGSLTTLIERPAQSRDRA